MSPTVAPFRAMRYDAGRVDLSKTLSPPYDVISDEDRECLYAADPHNFVRLDYGKPLSVDRPGSDLYDRSAAEFARWISDGILKRDPMPAIYPYVQRFLWNGRSLERRGFFALRRLERFGEGLVYPHERTLSGPKADRLSLMKSTRAQLSPVFGLYADPSRELKERLESCFQSKAEVDFTEAGGTGHRLWRATNSDFFRTADKILSKTSVFIADGHHRYETALTYRDFIVGKTGPLPENSSLNYVLFFFCESSDPGLLVLPTHRVVFKADVSALKENLAHRFDWRTFGTESDLRRELESDPAGPARFGFLFSGESSFHLLTLKAPLDSLPVVSRDVDTAVLHRLVLRDFLGFSEEDERDPARIRFVKDTAEAIAARGKADAVILCRPQMMDVFRRVAEAGLVLPPKTTYFYPKLPSGLLVQILDPSECVSV